MLSALAPGGQHEQPPTYQLTGISPVHLEATEGVSLGVSDQLSDHCVLHPLQEVLEPRRCLIAGCLEELLRCRLSLSKADCPGRSLGLGLRSVHVPGLTASLEQTKC